MSEDPERELIKEEAVAELRAALVRGTGVDSAVRGCFYRHPLFAVILMGESLRLLFGVGGDLRRVTAFVGRIRRVQGREPGAFPSREAEALVRACLGERAMLDAVQPSHLNYPELGIAIMTQLFDEWRPDLPHIQEIFERTEHALDLAVAYFPELAPAEADWYAAGMPSSPFAVLFTDLPRPAGNDESGN